MKPFTIYSIQFKSLLFWGIIAASSIIPATARDNYQLLAERLAAASTLSIAAEGEVFAQQASLRASIIPSDPEVEFEYMWPGISGEANRWSAGISQEIPNFFKINATRKVITALDSLAELRRLVANSAARFEAENRLLEIIAARKEHQMTKELSESYDKLLTTYQTAWEKGEVNILDLNKIKIEQARSAAALEETEGQLAALIEATVTLSRGILTASDLEQLTEYPLRNLQSLDYYQQMLAASPETGVIKAAADVALRKLSLAGKERIPSLTLGYRHAFEDGTHFNGFSASLSLPVFSRKAVKAEAQNELLTLTAESLRAKMDMEATVRADYNKAVSLKRQLDRLGPVIETTDNLRLLQLALEGGELSLLDYLQETNYFIEAIRDYNVAAYNYASALASLGRYKAQ